MKKTLFFVMAMALSFAQVMASPVDVNQAQKYGLQFAKRNLSVAKQISSVDLAYTATQSNGNAAFYVFNFEGGFVIVAADDVAQPILAFSEEGSFDAANMPDGMRDFLSLYAKEISYAVETGMEQETQIAEQWMRLAKDGSVSEKSGEKGVNPLINLKWNQDSPYNRLCPAHNYGPGGHVYAGCAADAMAMVMKYWNWPDHGAGTYSYTPQGFPMQTADFENTYYDWNNMPIQITNGSQAVQIDAVARLMWHCGVSIDMQYGYNGSGAQSGDVPGAISTYFRYTSAAELLYRDSYSRTQWEDKLIESLDRGIPFYYSGVDGNEGHAFVCDGYRDDRYFHFNFGWSGYGDSYYAIDAVNPPGSHFNEYNAAVFNFIPDYIYDGYVAAPELNINAINANSKQGVITWENPSVNYGGETIENIEKIVIERNGVQVFAQENVAAGATMSFTDEVPEFDSYVYTVYYITNNMKGRVAEYRYQYGPTCYWKIVGQTTNFQGWNDGKIQLVNSFGNVVEELTMTSATPISYQMRVPEGNVTFKWIAPSSTVQSITINIKNSSNESVYSYSGSSANIPSVLTTEENDCSGCLPPDNLAAEYVYEAGDFGTLLTWEYADEPKNFKIYRSVDNVNYEEVGEADKAAREYFDIVDAGTYYYKVTAYRNHCESTPAWANDGNDYVTATVTSVCENEAEMTLFPNPVNGNLTIKAEGMTEVVISNMMGQIVGTFACSENQVIINTTQFEAGIYNATISTANGTASRRFTVMH